MDKDKKQALAASMVEKEMDNGDLFTRRARPAMMYFGMLVILSELFGLRFWMLTWMEAPEVVIKQSNAILEYFLFTWGGIAGIYIGGRSLEKSKMRLFQKSK